MATKRKVEVFTKLVSSWIAMRGLNEDTLDLVILDKICFRNSASKGKTNRISKSWLFEAVISAGFTKEQWAKRWSYYLDTGLITQEVYEGLAPVQLSIHNSSESAVECAEEGTEEQAPVKTTKVPKAPEQAKPVEIKEEVKVVAVEVIDEELTLATEKLSAPKVEPKTAPAEAKVETKEPASKTFHGGYANAKRQKEKEVLERQLAANGITSNTDYSDLFDSAEEVSLTHVDKWSSDFDSLIND
jgi:hypothetical protein